MHLSHIASPADVKALDRSELPVLCDEIRHALLASSAQVGGHVAPNLAVIELSVALHRVFDSPTDKIVFDVSHQTYAHKALTGRAASYLDPARFGEVSGFSNPLESEHDLFAMGHTSTSIGLAVGLAKARDLAGDSYNVVAVIGDGALSGGLAFEGLDNAAELNSGLIIIVNDNDQSIAENHGGLYGCLARLRASKGAAPDNFFRSLGLDYRYLDAGNDVFAVTDALTELRGIDHPMVLHVRTVKGYGFPPAQEDPESWHHVGPFDLKTGTVACKRQDPDYAELTATHLLPLMEKDRSIVAISAATPYIMGFTPERREQAGEQFVDVGIAEEHAVTFACALAQAGAKPVFGVYGTFLQRAYDELWHDLCLNSAPVTLLVFGASVMGTTDQTHLGYFDIPMLGNLPGMRYLAPTGPEEYLAMLDWALTQREQPVAIRVPVLSGAVRCLPEEGETYARPTWRIARRGTDVAIAALGDFFDLGACLADALEERGVSPTLVNPRFATELDTATLDELAASHRLIVTLEDGAIEGGWGEKVARHLAIQGAHVRCHAIAPGFPDRYDKEALLQENGMDLDSLVADTLARL